MHFSLGKWKNTPGAKCTSAVIEVILSVLWICVFAYACIDLFAHMCNACMCGGVCVAASGPVERVYLSAPIVAIRGKKVNLTVVVWPSHTRTLAFFWWFDNSSEVRSFSSHSRYCFAHTFLSCLLQYFPSSLDVLSLLFTKCKSTEL